MAGSLRFGLLGPLEVVDQGRACAPTAPRLRTLLALLLVRANTVVSRRELVEELWGVDPPSGAANTLQVFVGRLRQSLAPDLGPRDPDQVLRTSAAGYSLRLAPEQLDVSRFERRLTEGRRTFGDGDAVSAAESLRAALALWRGPALADVSPGSVLQSQALALEEARLTALEGRVEADLRLGRHRELVGELWTLATRHPLREEFWRQLMIALYRSGRQAEALDAYQRLRNALIEELGLEPGAEVRRLQQAILLGDPSLDVARPSVKTASDPAAPPVALAQLPTGIADFMGRSEHLAKMRAVLLGDTARSGGGVAPVAVISGKAGVGKTALAVHAAHACRAEFPDGQLYVNLRGAAGRPTTPAEVLARFLRTLGFDGAGIPDTVEERSELYRSRLAGRRVLVLLDDAVDEAQVRPLMPGGMGGTVLVTSRRRLPGLEGAVAVDLPVFASDEAVELLGRLAGDQRVAADGEAAQRITELCGMLPLAVRVAGAKLAARPHWEVRDLAHRLADERHRLGELRAGDLDVRASFELSYQSCDPMERQAFRLLACAPAPEFPAWVLAAACDVDVAAAESVVERLVDAQLLQAAGRDGVGQFRYQFHDLLKVFAAERLAAEESEAQRRAALTRVLTAYSDLAQHADAVLRPGRMAPQLPPSEEPRWQLADELVARVAADPVRWYAAERVSLVAAVTKAHAAEHWSLTGVTAAATIGFFDLRSYWDDWRLVSELALHAAQQAQDMHAAAIARYYLGLLHADRGRITDADECFQACLTMFEQLGCHGEAAHARYETAMGLLDERRAAEALEQAHQSLEVFVKNEDRRGEAFTRRAIGNALQHQGQLAGALEHLDRSLALFRELEDRRWEAYLLLSRAGVNQLMGELQLAADDVDMCLSALRALDDRRWEAFALRTLADVRRRQSRWDDAEACYRRALAIMRRLGDRRSAGHLSRSLGDLCRVRGRLREARLLLEHSLEIFMEFRDGRGRPLALLGLGNVALSEGRHRDAVKLTERSLALLRELSMPIWEARALTSLGEALAGVGDSRGSRRRWRQALEMFREIGAAEAAEVAALLAACKGA